MQRAVCELKIVYSMWFTWLLVEAWLSSEILEEVSDSHTSLKEMVGRKAVHAVVLSLTRSNWKVNAVALAVAVARREEVIRSLIRSN